MSNNDLFEDVELATPSNTDTGVVDVIQEDRPKLLTQNGTTMF